MSEEVYVLGGLRTPIGKFGGSLRSLTAVDLGAHVSRAALEAVEVEPQMVDLAVVGLARQAGTGPNPGRLISTGAGVPTSAPAYTVQQACLSGMLATIEGARAIRLGEAEVVLAAGVEHMTNIPHFVFGARWGKRMGDMTLVDGLFRDGFIDPLTGKHMGELCDLLADRYGISREAQDAFALESQRRWAAARAEQADDEIIAPVRAAGKVLLERDEHPRPNSTADDVAKLEAAGLN
ncbi:MAG: hypothetical protein KGM44_10085 [bacterium]|nr:hypothetical protein [bacterium]